MAFPWRYQEHYKFVLVNIIMSYFYPLLQLPSHIFAILFFILGSIMGSFIAALTIRWPQGKSVMHGRSICDHCHESLAFIDLIPIISFILFQAKCRRCKGDIASEHFYIEIIAALTGAIPFILFPPDIALGWVLFLWPLFPLAILDFKYLWLPNRLLLFALIPFPIILFLWDHLTLSQHIIGALAAYIFLEIIRIASAKILQKDAMGQADPKLFGVIGLYLGWSILPLIMLFASAIGLALILFQKLIKSEMSSDQKFPLGTYMILAAPISAIASDFL